MTEDSRFENSSQLESISSFEYSLPALTVQTERWEEKGEPEYVSLTSDDLANLSDVMSDLLRHVGVRAGDRILVYDFNTSLSTLVMSRVFAPGLKKGASERIGCVAICTDGLSELAARTAHVYARWQPTVLLIRSDLVAPFLSKLPSGGMKRSNPTLRTVIISHNDVAPWPRNNRVGPGNFDRFLLYSMDQPLFMCLIKSCGGLYYPSSFYKVGMKNDDESAGARGKLVVAPTFIQNPKSYASSLDCESADKCGCGEKHEFRAREELVIV